MRVEGELGCVVEGAGRGGGEVGGVDQGTGRGGGDVHEGGG